MAEWSKLYWGRAAHPSLPLECLTVQSCLYPQRRCGRPVQYVTMVNGRGGGLGAGGVTYNEPFSHKIRNVIAKLSFDKLILFILSWLPLDTIIGLL